MQILDFNSQLSARQQRIISSRIGEIQQPEQPGCWTNKGWNGMVQGLHQEEGRGALNAGPAQVGGSLWVGNDNPSHFLLILLRISFNLHWNAQWELPVPHFTDEEARV